MPTMADKRYNLWQHYGERSLTYIVEGNKIITDVVRLMLGGGTFIFVLSGTLYGNHITSLPISLKILIVVSWVLILCSFASGIVQLVRDSTHLGSWSSTYRSAMDSLADETKNEDDAILAANTALSRNDTVSNMVPFWFQVVTLAIAFVIQVTVASISLFI